MKVAIVYHSETGNTARMAELIREGCESVAGVEARTMSLEEVDKGYIGEAKAVILGCPNYEGTCSWQMKRYLDTGPGPLAGKLGGVFTSQNWPGGGGGSFVEMTMIAGMLIHGMLIYAGGIKVGHPPLHFGAVSTRAPTGLDAERCLKLGQNIAGKAKELFGG